MILAPWTNEQGFDIQFLYIEKFQLEKENLLFTSFYAPYVCDGN